MKSCLKETEQAQKSLLTKMKKDRTGFLDEMAAILKKAKVIDKNGKLTKKYK